MDEEGWVDIQDLIKLECIKKFDADYGIMLAIGKGLGSGQNRPIYEINKIRTHIRRIGRYKTN